MKKFKEFVKKIGDKKRCLLSLLLAGLLIFAIVSGLKGSKSAVTEVNAQSAPTTKNLDLNGIRYTYQTSLNELKNTYGFFKKWYYIDIIKITNNSEGETQLLYNNNDEEQIHSLDSEQITRTIALLQQSINFYTKELNSDKLIQLNNNLSQNTIDGTNETNELVFDFDNIDNFNRLKNISINFSLLKRIPYYNQNIDDLTFNSFTMNFIYVNNDLDNSQLHNIQYMDKNVKCFSYCFSNQIEYYNFDLPIIEGYTIRNIYLSYEETEEDEQSIIQSIPNEYIFLDKNRYIETAIFIDNITFYNNSDANIISYYFGFIRDNQNPVFKDNILLSNDKRDEKLIADMRTKLGPKLIFNFNGGGIFGGNFQNNKLINSFYLNYDLNGVSSSQKVIADLDDVTLFNDNVLFTYNNILPTQKAYNTYTNQNQLLFLQKAQTLTAEYENTWYKALSAQVEDILYNVGYVGDVAQKEFNEKVQDDFIDLIKTTGIGAVIGLLIGFLFGNPIGGLVIGAVIGFAVAIIPLIIDGLQALFGYDFLSGLYNFFNAITEFFVNIIDTIVNFLLSIITNPFILVLIVLVAILYIFVIRPKIK